MQGTRSSLNTLRDHSGFRYRYGKVGFEYVLIAAAFLATFAISAQAQPAASAATASSAQSLASQAPSPSPAQSPQNEPPAMVLHRTVRRVIVDVVVTDAQGHPVSGLQAGDFHVFEDGHEQTIGSFDVHSPGHAVSALPPPPTLPAHTFMNYPAVPRNAPLTVILYDVLNTPIVAQSYAHQALVDFLKKNSAHNQTAIFVLSDRLYLLQGFTSDTGELLAAASSKRAAPHSSAALQETGEVEQNAKAVDNINPNGPSGAAASAANQVPAEGSPAGQMDIVQALTNAEAEEASALADRRVDITLEAFGQISRFLAGTPARKNLIWLSGSFPAGIAPDTDSFSSNDQMRNYIEQMKETNDLLSAGQIAVYPLDVRGLIVNPALQASSARQIIPGEGASKSGPVPVPPDVKAIQDFVAQQTAEQATMDQIADQSGGRAFYNTNGLDQALQTALVDGNNYYSLTYAPTNAKFDGSLRHIKVNLDRSGCHLAYRTSYFADDLDTGRNPSADLAPDRAEPGSLTAAMQFGGPPSHELIFVAHVDAMGAPTPASAEQMDALTPYLETASRIRQTKLVKPQTPILLQRYVVIYAVLAKLLDLSCEDGNMCKPKLTFAALAFDSDGFPLNGVQASVDDAIPTSRISTVEKEGYRKIQTIDVPVNAASLRLGVRDARTNRIGAIEIRLPLSPAPQSGAIGRP